MKDLIKKLFWPKNNYVEILPMKSKDINKFFDNVKESHGKILGMNISQKIDTEVPDNPYQHYEGTVGFTSSSESVLIHYKCYKQIAYLSELPKDESFEESINSKIKSLENLKEQYMKQHQKT